VLCEPGTCKQNIQKERCQKDAKREKGRRKGASNEREDGIYRAKETNKLMGKTFFKKIKMKRN